MATYAFRLLNVFAESTFGGNQLCVFEDGRGLDDASMLALTLQFNLSETTFILPSDQADARVRIFTPGYEMRFAGHPTLGTSQVVRALRGTGQSLKLEFLAGVVPVWAQDDVWTFTAPQDGPVKHRAEPTPAAELAVMLGLREDDLLDTPRWIDTGADQLLVPVRSADAVRRAAPGASFDAWPASSLGRKTAYVFAFEQEPAGDQPGQVLARYFFSKGGAVVEDPGTGSACANLGGWLVQQGRTLPASYRVSQGEAVGRPCTLRLHVTEDQQVQVGGRVIEIGRGTVTI
ncbi:PhzF family phenazine biosynthesis protein [Bordetella sp. N]|uniref:PhzF family phenazine biosynthesis protein n=1 Tax=Bordetella sp. N TaxID=1746199 RepID=UPI00070D4412|nr:PhzF family phenazine biosynthesis protein [Bordetella sp. N]ALM86755.1 phenazine biosynthesis protein PhzC/PhzF [Bordetella sp. N]